ncbi:MAG: hypothetical protein VCE75_16845 [Alphaproteobacteria bacterium]
MMGAILLLCAVLGMFAVHRFVAAEDEQELHQWQVRLGIVAASRAQSVLEWRDLQFKTLSGLADNLSLQLYLTELPLSGGQLGEITDQSAQAEYLGNLLLVTADQSGFASPVTGPEVQANVQRSLALDTPHLAAAALMRRTGGFGTYANYQGRQVVATSRGIQGMPWTLIRSVDRAEALAASDRRQMILLIGLWLVIAMVTTVVYGVWRHGSSVRLSAAAEGLRQSNAQLQTVSDFLRVVTDSQPTASPPWTAMAK